MLSPVNYLDKFVSLLSGERVLEERESKYNGKITVIGSPVWGTHIQVGGLTQSGGILEDIWRKPLKKVHSSKFIVHRILILGLGGGSAAKIVRKLWPEAKITGVDIDPMMVELGEKYLGLKRNEIEIEIEDACDFLTKKLNIKNQNDKSKLKNIETSDLILVDLYIGKNYPEKFESEEFMQHARELLAKSGIAIFNRFYGGDDRPKVVKFGNRLEKVFSKVEWFYPEANLMFICQR
jgi:spermidine synthase